MKVDYYRCDGIFEPGRSRPPSVTSFYKDGTGSWYMTNYDVVKAQDVICIPLHETIRMAVMNEEEYKQAAPLIESGFIYDVGIDPESAIGKVDFEKVLAAELFDASVMNRCLYWQDFSFLVSNIQSAVTEIVSSAGEFYKCLCTPDTLHIPDEYKLGVRRKTSAEVSMTTLLMHMVFVRMYSALDYSVKLALEADRENPTFESYPKLVGVNHQFKSKKKVSFDGQAGTLFEDCDFIRKIGSIRNRIIHDGHLSPNQWIYERFEDRKVVERFILFPDMISNPGAFDKSGNRSSFYKQETKANLELPELIAEFLDRTFATLTEIKKRIDGRRR